MEKLNCGLKLGGSALALVAVSAFVAGSAAAQPLTNNPNASEVESVTVTGTSIRGVATVGSNLITVDQDAIQTQAPVNVQEMLQAVTAISSDNGPPQGQTVYSYYAPQIHDLAGSASNSTLVLVDGLRPTAGGTQGYVESDPGIIPTLAIERVEVLADGASSIYGSDAVAGVVNFITRKSYDGVELQAQSGIGASYSNDNFGVLAGNHWDTGSAMFAAGYTYQSALRSDARPILSMGNYAPLGGTKFDETFGCPVAAMAVAGSSSLYLSPSATTPVSPTVANYDCNTSQYGDALPQTARYNTLARFNQSFLDSKLNTSVTLIANLLKTKADAAPGTISNVTVYGPGSGKGGQINPFYQAPAGAPTATSETVDWVDLMGNGSNAPFGYNTTEEDALYGTFVATYDFSNSWQMKFSDAVAWDRSNAGAINTFCAQCAYLGINGTAQTSASTTTTDISGQNTITLNTPLTAANAIDIWNPAGSANQSSAAALQNTYRGETDTSDFNTMNQMRLEANGNLFNLPAGPLKAAIGGEWVNYHLIHNVLSSDLTGAKLFGLEDLVFDYNRAVYSGYVEFDAPLISPEMNIPFVQKLELDISGRYDDYSDVGSTSNPKYAMNWDVMDGLRLRANYSTSFVAPPMGVIGSATLGGMYSGGAGVTNGGIVVPVAAYPTVTQLPGCAAATVTCTLPTSDQGLNRQFGGGLDNVKPQTGDGWSIGADIAPDFLPGFQSNITLWNNAFKGGITTPTLQLIESTPSFQNRLTICPGGCSAAQVAAFTRTAEGAIFTGTLPSTVYFLYNHDESNVIYLNVQGIDATVSYAFNTDLGTFKVADNATVFTQFNQQGGPTGTPYSVLNTSGLNVTFPSVQTQMRADLGWAEDEWAVDFFWNYTSPYRWVGANPVNPVLDNGPNGTFSGGGDAVKANNTFDAHVSYNLPDGWLAGDQIYVDGKNIFNAPPPFVNGNVGGITTTQNGYNAFLSNPIGRVLSLGFRAKF